MNLVTRIRTQTSGISSILGMASTLLPDANFEYVFDVEVTSLSSELGVDRLILCHEFYLTNGAYIQAISKIYDTDVGVFLKKPGIGYVQIVFDRFEWVSAGKLDFHCIFLTAEMEQCIKLINEIDQVIDRRDHLKTRIKTSSTFGGLECTVCTKVVNLQKLGKFHTCIVPVNE